MSSAFSEPIDTSTPVENDAYRTMSQMSLLALIFGVLSGLGFLVPVLIGFSFFGFVASVLGLRTIKRYPTEYFGRRLALAGGLLSAATVVCAIPYHAYVYYTEVPDGYVRVPFKMLQRKKGDPELIPSSALELDGKQIFVGGYIHPDAGMEPVQSFVLVPDMGTCCFGGQPELTDMIEVTLQEKDQVRYSTRKRKFAGTLRVNPNLKPREKLQGTYYQLTVDKVVR